MSLNEDSDQILNNSILKFISNNHSSIINSPHSQTLKSRLNNFLQNDLKISNAYGKIFTYSQEEWPSGKNFYPNSVTLEYLKSSRFHIKVTHHSKTVKEAETGCLREILLNISERGDNNNYGFSNSLGNKGESGFILNDVKKKNYSLSSSSSSLSSDETEEPIEELHKFILSNPGIHLILPKKGEKVLELCFKLKQVLGFDVIDTRLMFSGTEMSKLKGGCICPGIPFMSRPHEIRDYVSKRNNLKDQKGHKKWRGDAFSMVIIVKKKEAGEIIKICNYLNGVEYE
jgi:hypothetical protein